MSRSAVFIVNLSRPSAQTVTVNYTTVSGTATSGSDFTPTSGTITFAPGQTSAQVIVPIQDPRQVGQPKETFTLSITGASNAVIGDGSGVGYIPAENPTEYPVVTAQDAEGLTTINIPVSLSQAHTIPCRVSYSCKSISAIAGKDYTPVSGQLEFAVGETSKTVSVTIQAKTDRKLTFKLQLAKPEKVTLFRIKTGIGTITPDPNVVWLVNAVRTAFAAFETAVAERKKASTLLDKVWMEWDNASRDYLTASGDRSVAQANVSAGLVDVENCRAEVERVTLLVALGYATAFNIAAAQQSLANAQTRLTNAQASLAAAEVKEAELFTIKDLRFANYTTAKQSFDNWTATEATDLELYNTALAAAKAAFVGSTKFEG